MTLISPAEDRFWRLLPLFYALPFLVVFRSRPVLAVFCGGGCAAARKGGEES